MSSPEEVEALRQCAKCSAPLARWGCTALQAKMHTEAIGFQLCIECVLRYCGRTGVMVSIQPPFPPRCGLGDRMLSLAKSGRLKYPQTDSLDLVGPALESNKEQRHALAAKEAKESQRASSRARMAIERAEVAAMFRKAHAGGFSANRWPNPSVHERTGCSTYRGTWLDGEPHGSGLVEWRSGEQYQGTLDDGFLHGEGTKTWRDGGRYVGSWRRGLFHGKGMRTFADGSTYEGEYADGRQCGMGVQTWPDGTVYEGNFDEEEVRNEPASMLQAAFRGLMARRLAERMRTPRVTPPSLAALALRALAKGVRTRPDRFSATMIKERFPRHLKQLLARALLEGVDGITDKFKAVVPSIAWTDDTEVVRFTNGRPTAADLSMLSYFLKSAERVREVQLQWNHLGPVGAEHVAAFIEANKALASIDLGWNGVGAAGIVPLCRGFARNPTLRVLKLAGNKLRERGAASIAAWLQVNSAITELDLGFNELGVAGCAHIAQALKVNKGLVSLNLRNNELGPQGGALLVEALRFNDGGLKKLVLTDNHLGPRQAGALARICKGSTAQRLAMFGMPQSINNKPVKLLRGDYMLKPKAPPSPATHTLPPI
jgi:hypothetical protein